MKSLFFLLFLLLIACDPEPIPIPPDGPCSDCILVYDDQGEGAGSDCGIVPEVHIHQVDGDWKVIVTLPSGCIFEPTDRPSLYRLTPWMPNSQRIDLFRLDVSGSELIAVPFNSEDIEHILELGFTVSTQICCYDQE